ncbi:2-dehydro-3-deoxyphosphogluconate aldolase [Oceanobacillus arenosus]|uniref:2-dehydro-3-deoxyphosphogluconate aldolase n=1 Tax=Oceanobacillus arenosus TaxID=1229153 RepID=A0A3D8Q451_9BACI|nr:bifunctional 4-hydroxy-2-oxoglutarate aldolase/2-dehydro-3-deoxy-phosphogluconate aldolase [Oceanobacillus arenosus]RDW22155.1 2-dehydro-3-deoxyphosphogluconate aldolase [Oceanobacillus arenosus]
MDGISRIKENGIVAIIRGQQRENIVYILEALLKGGIRTVEVTADTHRITFAIEEAVKEFGDEMYIGAGTVLDPETAKLVINSGAKFVISPTTNIETIRLTKRYGVLSMPAAMTPTEILTAFEAGADVIKLFPARSLGASYIKDVRGPLPQVPILPTGGIGLENMNEFFRAGAIGVGIGSSLVKGNMTATPEELMELTSRAKLYADKFVELKQKGVVTSGV